MLELQPKTEVTIAAATAFGMVLTLLGSLKLELGQRLGLSEGRIRGLFAIFNAALVPMTILSGIFIDLYGVTWALLLSSVASALALLGLGLLPSYSGALLGLLIAALGCAGVGTASIVLMPDAFFGPRQITASLNLGTVFFALGALVATPLAALLRRKLAWQRTLSLLSVACLVPAILAVLFNQQLAADTTSPAEATPFLELLNSHAVLLAGVVLFFYVPLEGAISAWITAYVTDAGLSEPRVTRMLSAFWSAFLVGRLLTAVAAANNVISDRWDKPFLVVLPLLVAAVLGNLAGTANRKAAGRGALVIGLLLGPIFPTLVSLLFKNMRHEEINVAGTAYGIIFAMGSLGSLALAPWMGKVTRQRDVRAALRIPMFVALVLAIVALVFSLLVTAPALRE